MIENLGNCPYCRVAVAVDTENWSVVLDPDGSGEPCPHLVYVDAYLTSVRRKKRKTENFPDF
jgi:hypothetical protein